MEQRNESHATAQRPTILCLAHLGWDYVWQRPQHILSRLSRHYRVIYVNEPYPVSPAQARTPRLRPVARDNGLTAWQPLFPDDDEVLGNWRNTYLRLVQQLGPGRPLILWFYTPTPYYFLDHIKPDLVVYDVMDDLASFQGAARDLREREAKLLPQVDVVFAGGRSLYRSRRDSHPRVLLIPSGVEPDHFAAALAPDTELAPEIADLPRPILGYIGVIDERIDLALLDAVAAQHPEWSLVMVGPTAKIEADALPQRPNIHYLGKKPYARLPEFLKSFDVCLMPFALNEATRAISPTKTLEYMAAHKPIVSTAVPDVVANWSDVVRIAEGAHRFAAAVNAALQETAAQRRRRIRAEEAHLAQNTWDAIAEKMKQQIDALLPQGAEQKQNV